MVEEEKKNTCATCGIRTHRGPKFSRVELKNDDVHYGVCIKCNPKNVPPSVLKAWKQKNPTETVSTAETPKEPKDSGDAASKSEKRVSIKEGEKKDAGEKPPAQKSSAAARPTVASSSSRSMTASQRSMNDEEKSNHCLSCGIRTHRGPKFARIDLKNVDVHYGVCIKCNPQNVPPAALKAYQEKASGGATAAAAATKTSKPASGGAAAGAAAATAAAAGKAATGSSRNLPVMPLSLEKELVQELSVSWSQAREYVVKAKADMSIGATDPVDSDMQAELKAKAKEYHAKNPNPKPITASSRKLVESDAAETTKASATKAAVAAAAGAATATAVAAGKASTASSRNLPVMPLSLEKELVQELSVSWSQAREYVVKAKADMSIGATDPVDSDLQAELKAKAKEYHAKNPNPKPLTASSRKLVESDAAETTKASAPEPAVAAAAGATAATAAAAGKAATDSSRYKPVSSRSLVSDEDKSNHCHSCGIRTHRGPKFSRMELKNEDVHYGICIKCNRKAVPPSVLKSWKETHEEEAKEDDDSAADSAAMTASSRALKKESNHCQSCGVRTHKGPKFARVELKNDDVHYGVCIKCNPKDVPPSVLKTFKEVRDTEVADAPKMPAASSSRNLNEDYKSNHCESCGIRTHRGPKFSRIELKNDDIHYGVCVKCNPNSVPPAALQAWKDKHGSEPKKAASGAPVVAAAAATAATVAAVGVTSNKPDSPAAKATTSSKPAAALAKEITTNKPVSVAAKETTTNKAVAAAAGGAAAGAAVGVAAASAMKKQSSVRRKSMEKELVEELDVSWSQARDYVVESKRELGIDENELDIDQEAKVKAKAKEIHAKNPEPKRLSASSRNMGAAAKSAETSDSTKKAAAAAAAAGGAAAAGAAATSSSRNLTASQRSLNEEEKSNHCTTCGIRTHRGPKFARVELKNSDVHYGICVKCHPKDVPPQALKAFQEKEPATASSRNLMAEEETANHCSSCGIRTHKGPKLSRVELKNDDVYYGICIKCNRKGVPPSVLKSWEELHEEEAQEVDSTAMTASGRVLKEESNHCQSCGVRTHRGPKFARVELKNEDVHYGKCIKCNQKNVPPSVLKAWKELRTVEAGDAPRMPANSSSRNLNEDYKSNHCHGCGIRTHRGPKFARAELKNDDVHYGICIKCNPRAVPPQVVKAWKEKKDEPETTDPGTDDPKNFCPTCGVRTHTGNGMHREPLKNDKVHYGKCIKCNSEDESGGIDKGAAIAAGVGGAAAGAATGAAIAGSPSKRRADLTIEEERRADDVKKGLCPDCGTRTHNVGWFNRDPLKNADVHYGVCIKCHPKAVPPAVLETWEESHSNRELPGVVAATSVVAKDTSEEKAPDTAEDKVPDTGYLARTFDIPEDVMHWLDGNLSKGDLSAVVLASASGKPISSYMKPSGERRRRRKSSHRSSSEEVAALRAEMSEMRKSMKQLADHVDPSGSGS